MVANPWWFCQGKFAIKGSGNMLVAGYRMPNAAESQNKRLLHVGLDFVLAHLPSCPVDFQVIQGEIGSIDDDHGKSCFLDCALEGLHHASLVCACRTLHSLNQV